MQDPVNPHPDLDRLPRILDMNIRRVQSVRLGQEIVKDFVARHGIERRGDARQRLAIPLSGEDNVIIPDFFRRIIPADERLECRMRDETSGGS